MNGLSKTSLDLRDTKRIHNAWKSRIYNFIQSPLLRGEIKRQETNETCLLGESLETLISQKCGRIAFWDFLKSEFCEENLDFWLACQEFKTSDRPEELTRRAASIYEEFIGPESPRQVNLDFYTREIIRQSLQQPSPSCFVVAQRKIFSLMENCSFPRFTQSEQYKVLLSAAAAEQRGLPRHRKALKIRSTGDLMQHDSKPISLQRELYLWHKD
ncbi:regulator of G-protein signaling 21-like [Cebidichthys violaceus]|uniref:regulator of G-protein signaling 21-like n=1 Tax=Cebidichthys violaceus TaxID=271503 RepID=UPI0035CBA7C5